MPSEKNFLGKEFTWFFGVVEDRMDPLDLGRVRVRCQGFHTQDKTELPTDHLPWAMVGIPTTEPGVSGLGRKSNLVEGSLVAGFFMDGFEEQQPFVMFSIPTIPGQLPDPSTGFNDPRTDTSQFPKRVQSRTLKTDGTGSSASSDSAGATYPIATNRPDTSLLQRNAETDQTIVQFKKDTRQTGIKTVEGSWDEPEIPYDAKFPFNDVSESESGHVREVDDTPGHERLHEFHRAGTFREIHPDGSVVEKTVNDKHEIVLKDDRAVSEGMKTVTVGKGMELLVNQHEGGDSLKIKVGSGGNLQIVVENGDVDLRVSNGNVNKYIKGNLVEKIDGNVTREIGGSVTENVGGDKTAMVGGNQIENVSGNSQEIQGGVKAIQGTQVLIN